MTRRRTAIYYLDPTTGLEPARDWLKSLKDSVGQARIYARVERAEGGNFGDHRSVGEGVMELRIDVGPGYRVYYTLDGTEIILLLIGGSKSTQQRILQPLSDFGLRIKAKLRKESNMAKGTKFQDDLNKKLTNTDFAADYLSAAIIENDEEFLTDALAKIIKIHGASKIAEEIGVTRQAIYKMISGDGNPSFKNINKLLEAVGLVLLVRRKKSAS